MSKMQRKDALFALLFWICYTALIAGMAIAAIGVSTGALLGGFIFIVVMSVLITALTVGNQNKDYDE
jgi:mannose/fructose/N-acetylgalactosamine-specific phosphotransferase system component IID